MEPVRPFSLLSSTDDLNGLGDDAAQQCGVSKHEVVDLYPCTSLQAGLMAQSLKQPGTYIGHFVRQIPETVDINRFRAAWITMARQEILMRTRIIQSAVGLLQAVVSSDIDPAWHSLLTIEDFTQKTSVMELGQPLVHFGVIESERVFLLTLHHAVYDAWTLDLLFEGVHAIYERGQGSENPTDFRHFVQHMQSQSQEEARNFWTEQLASTPLPSFPRLPSARYIPSTDSVLTCDVSLPSSGSSGILASTVITASWAAVVARHSDVTNDAIFGVTYSGRSAPVAAIERIMGPTIATVPFRVQIDEDQLVESFLSDIQRQATAISKFEQYGLPNIRGISEQAVDFQSLLVIQAAADVPSEAWLPPVQRDRGQQTFHNFALSVECTMSGSQVYVVCNYDSNVIPERQLRRLMNQFMHVIQQLAVPQANQRLHEIRVVSPEDLAEIEQWNFDISEHDNRLVHHVVHETASKQPTAPAIVSWDRNFTYKQLNETAGSLANALVASGVTVGQRVPFLFEKGSWAIVAMLAILKAGAACVALDPEQPFAHIRDIISQVRAKTLLTSDIQYNVAENLENNGSLNIIPVGPVHRTSWEAFPCVSHCEATPQDGAFVLFNSDSTGTPQGTIIHHAAFCSSIRGHGEVLRFYRGPGSRNLQFAAYTSYVSIGEIFTSLALGACICVPSDEERTQNLVGAIERMTVDWAFLTPSIASILLPAAVPTIRTLVLGGEVPSRKVIEDWADSVYLINSFGYVESSVWTHCAPGVPTSHDGSNIGHQMHCRTWITDPGDSHRMAPIGAIGEMLIEGPNIAQGYLDQDATEAHFITINQSGKAKRVLYRTGDLARYLPDGSVQFLGQRDMQAKIRGQRIDLAETEQELRKQLPVLREITAMMVRLGSEESPLTLAAFFNISSYMGFPASTNQISSTKAVVANSPAARQSTAILLEGLTERLAHVLPAYMIPSVYIPVWVMPLSSSAKIDRRHLRTLALKLSAEEVASFALIPSAKCSQALSTPREKLLARLWVDVLGIDSVSADDHFVSRGGDSLTAMRLVRDAQRNGLTLSVATIFQYPILSDMAVATEDLAPENGTSANMLLGHDVPPPFSLIPPETKDVSKLVAEVAKLLQVDDVTIQDVLPCSPLQEGLIALSLQRPGSYMAQFVYDVPATIDSARLQDAWQVVINSSNILRTRIIHLVSSTRLMQVVLKPKAVAWEQASDLDTYLAKNQHKAMRMGDPLVRIALISKSGKSNLVLTMHHAIYDEQSLQLLWASVKSAYRGIVLPRRLPFSCFIRHIQDRDTDTGSAAAFWKAQLNGAPAPSFPTLPTTATIFHARPDKQLQATMSLTRLNNTHITAAGLIRAAYALWLSLHTASDDVVFGTTMSGRTAPLPGIDVIDGPTIATVPVRVLCSRDQTVGDYLQQVQRQAADMLSFEQTGLQNIGLINESAQTACNFRTLLVIQAVPDSEASRVTKPEAELDCPLLPGGTVNAVFHTLPLILGCSLLPDGRVRLELLYDSRVLSPMDSKRMLHQFQHLLLQLANSQPDLALGEVAALPPSEVAMVRQWNSHPLSALPACLYTQLAKIAQRQPGRQAVAAYDGQYTYCELLGQASLVARRLIEAGIDAGTLVPICFERSSWAIVAMLGVWMAGAAFVPLDPSQPASRLEDIITQSAAPLALVSATSRVTIEPLLPVLELSAVALNGEQTLASAKNPELRPANPLAPAYVLFTSGSTGRAKGVVIDHQTLYTSLEGHLEPLQLGPGTRFLQFATYTFDISIAEIFDALLAGGCVCVPSPDIKLIGEAMEAMQVNTACFTPSVIQHLRPEEVPSLRTLILGGEAIRPEHVDTWASHVTLFNGYGLTETCILATLQRITSRASAATKTTTCNSSIGTAVGCHAWIVNPDNHHQLLPLGAIGELLVSGPILAREYLNDPSRTAVAFVSVPELGSGRFFKTGDLVQYGPEGSIRYIGRKDNVIKLRGQRIDLGEVEFRVKEAFSNVSSLAVVLAKRRDTPSLAVFFCPRVPGEEATTERNITLGTLTPEQIFDCQSAQATVARYLPSVMVPSLWIPVNNMPLTGAGKLFSRHLQQMLDNASEDLHHHYALAHIKQTEGLNPTTPIEQSLQVIWAETLGLDRARIGPNDSFFRLGGDSLSAIRLVAIAEARGLNLSVQGAFNNPTLVEMAQITSYRGDVSVEDEVAPFSLIPSPTEALIEACRQCGVAEDEIIDIYPSTHLQDGLMVLSIKQPGTYIASFAFTLPDSLDLSRYRASWNKVVAQLPILRTRIAYTADSGFQQVVLSTEMRWTEYETDTLQSALTSERNMMRTAIGQPLSQYAIIQNPGGERVFVWTAHHSIYDGRTVAEVIAFVEQTYFDLANDTTAKSLPDGAVPAVPFNRFIRYLGEQNSDQVAEYWREHLAGVPSPTFPALPAIDYQPVANAVVDHLIILGSSQQVSEGNVTMATKLRATWGLLLSLYENSHDISFGTTLSGRNSGITGINSIMGPTIATVPIRIQVPDLTLPIGRWLETVQQQAVEMIPFEQVGLQTIRKLHNDARAAVDFRTLFLVQNMRFGNTEHQSRLGLEQLAGQSGSFYTYPLVVTCTLHQDGNVLIAASYDDSLLESRCVERLVDQFANLLRQLHQAPFQSPLSELNMLPEFDAQQISLWNSTLIPVVDGLVHQEIHSMVQRQPERPAVTAWDGSLSYAELESEAMCFATYLNQRYDIGPEDKVPFCFDKSRWAVVAMLGILQAGGVVVALDPSHPSKHHSQILGQVKPKAIVTTPAHAALFQNHRLIILSYNGDGLQIMPPIDTATVRSGNTERVRTDNAAFIVFTSGTTGTPKGIVLEHRAVCTSARAHGQLLKVTPTSRVLQFAAHVFDVMVSDIFTTLIHGGCVCIPSEHDRLNNLVGAINSLNATQAYLTTTVASQLHPDQVPGLEVLSVGGERVTEHVVRTWVARTYLINMYGPAECTIWCAGTHVVGADAQPSDFGHGIGARLWLVNPADHRLLVPIGTVGEILVDGPILARGYLDMPDQTTSSFIQDAPWLRQGCRAYKTGDLGRYTADGTIEYLARQDGQIKLYGQRIELDAIGHHLRACLPDDYPVAVEVLSLYGNPVLVGFVALSQSAGPVRILRNPDSVSKLSQLLSTISDDLAAKLPHSMVPYIFLPISNIPLTLAGKINRRALQALGSELSADDVHSLSPQWAAKQPPATTTEKTLQGLWASILPLELESIGRNDSFLRLGGDSMAAMRLVAAARELSLYLTVADVFDRPILFEMAQTIIPVNDTESQHLPPFALAPTGDDLDALRKELAQLCQVPPSRVQNIYPCTPLQRTYIELSTCSPGITTLQNTYIIPPSVDIDRLRRAWEQVVAANSLLRTRIVYDPKATTVWQVVLDELPTWRTSTSLEAYYAQEVAEPMGSGCPLSRCAIIDGHYFVWTCNHAIYDAWSVGLVMGQLEQAYQGLALSPEAPFAHFIKHLLAVDRTAADVFWQKTLDNCQAQPLCQQSSTQVDSLLVLEMALPMRSHATEITMSTITQVAWAIVLARETARRDVVLGLTVTGRDTPIAGIERMTGPTIATIPLRITVHEEQSLDDLLRATQTLTKAAIPFQHVGMPHIRNISRETAQACDATVPIVINASNHHKEALGSAIGLERSQRTPLAESPLPFFIDCSASKDTLDVYTTFDSRVFPRARVQNMLSRFRYVLCQLCVDPAGITVGDLRMEDSTGHNSRSTIACYETHSGMSFDARTKTSVSMVKGSE
jgi:amino acid adenylation domain-containing protein